MKLMDFKNNALLLLCIGITVGIVVAEVVYYYAAPMVLAEGAVKVVTDRDYFDAAYEAISGAKKSIHVIMFSANYQTDPKYADSHVNLVLQGLVAARNNGIDVQVVMDSWPDGNEKTLKYLTDNNVNAKLIKFVGSTHSKLIIVDSSIVIVGSTNWSYYAIDLNHEANVLISDTRIAREFEDYFTYVVNSV